MKSYHRVDRKSDYLSQHFNQFMINREEIPGEGRSVVITMGGILVTRVSKHTSWGKSCAHHCLVPFPNLCVWVCDHYQVQGTIKDWGKLQWLNSTSMTHACKFVTLTPNKMLWSLQNLLFIDLLKRRSHMLRWVFACNLRTCTM